MLKVVSKAIENKANKQKGGLLPLLLGTLGVSLWGSMLSGKGVIQADEATIRAGQDSEFFLIL